MKLKDVLLIRKFEMLNKEHLKVQLNPIGTNYWIWADVKLEELNIPEGIVSEPYVYGPEEGDVEYLLYNNKGVKIAVLDSSPTKKIDNQNQQRK